MRRLHRQAARHTGRAVSALAGLALLVGAMTLVGGGALAFRLAQGPLESAWLTRQLEAAVNTAGAPAHLRIGSAALAWEGYRGGTDRPLDIRLTQVIATDAAGRRIARVPQAAVSLAIGSLIMGRLRPRAIEIDGAHLSLSREAGGGLRFDLGPPGEADAEAAPASEAASPWPGLLDELARPATTDRGEIRASILSELRRVAIRNGSLVVRDQPLGATWRARDVRLTLDRRAQGGISGNGQARLALGGQEPTLQILATLAPGGTKTELQASLTPVKPAALARAAPGLGALARLDAPLALALDAELGPALSLAHAALKADIGAGHATLGTDVIALDRAALAVEGNASAVTLKALSATLRPRDGGPVSNVALSGSARRDGPTLHASLNLGVDQVAFADLPALWPKGTGGRARDWITTNITQGTARDGHVATTIDAPLDLSEATLTSATGAVTGEGLTVHWLRPIGPIEHGRAVLHILDPDTLDIVVTGGQQHPEAAKGEPLTIRGGKLRITGIEHHTQYATIDADIAGGLGEAVGLLREPRLRLLDRHPLPGRDPSGQASIKLTIQLPLKDTVKIDDIAIHTQAHLEGVHLGELVAGRALDQGNLDLQASNDGLTLHGTGLVAGINAELAAEMDFRAGGPTEIVQTASLSGRADAAQLKAAGLDAGPLLKGSANISANLRQQRNGRATLAAEADLAEAALTAAPLNWQKPIGSPAHGSLSLVLDHDRLVGIEALTLEGKDLSIRGRADYAAGTMSALTLERIVLGRTSAHGLVRFPQQPGQGAIAAHIWGPVIDLAGTLQHQARPPGASQDPSPPDHAPGTPWSLDAEFSRAIMANGENFATLSAHAQSDGSVLDRLRVDGETGPARPFHLEIASERGSRRLTATAADAGRLFRGLDLGTTLEGGRLSLVGRYDDSRADRPVAGQAEITDFRIRDPNGLGRILQAMTLYGLVQAASGPGLGFSRLIAPFTYSENRIDFGECRAFSPSLGLTAKGHIDRRRNTADIQGTIVPAYFFNSLLGHLPVIGKLFSPEQGGGVFAATYTLRGPLENPAISVNPLSALTPGVLRGLFGFL